jgi:hypothetical protein
LTHDQDLSVVTGVVAAEVIQPVQALRLRKTSSGKRLRNGLLWLTGVDNQAWA